MPPKIAQAHQAVGYWGSSPRCRIDQDQTPQKIRALLQDQLRAGGLRARLWLSVHQPVDGENNALSGTLKCSCVKETGQSADRRCLSCHGIGFVPGYRLFGYETLWASSISPTLTLAGLQLNKTLKPWRLELAQGQVSGTATTPDLEFIRPAEIGGAWEARSSGTIKDGAASAIVSEFSIDGGLTWHDLAQLAVVNPPTGRIRFRVTLTRTSGSIATPQWEILRARFPTIATNGRTGPWILALKAVTPNTPKLDMRGNIIEGSSKFWTAPLSFFDCQIPDQAPGGGPLDGRNLIRDPAFVEFLEGVLAVLPAERHSVVNVAYSDPLGYFTRQYFDVRQQQPEEYTGLVW